MRFSFEVTDLAGGYGENPLFTQLKFTLNPGSALQVVGPNGSGKSTLLRILTGLNPNLGGDIFWQQQSIYQDLGLYQKNLIFLSDKLNLKPELNILENFKLFLNLRNESKSAAELTEIIHFLNLSPHTHLNVGQLSQGQKRRAAAARLLLYSAPLWILDEPFNALDQLSIELFTQLFKQHLDQQGMIIFTSHQPIQFNQTLYHL